jgi:hypothetical protein
VIERGEDALGDGHAAIRGARHHLVQYLGWEAWQREDLLTAREKERESAYSPGLEAMSLRVLAERERPPSRPRQTAARARARLAGLAGFVRGAPPVRTRWRSLALAGALAAGAGVLALAVVDAVRYHGAYSERQKQLEREKADHGKN